MKKGEKFYKVEALISKEDLDKELKLNNALEIRKSKPQILLDKLERNGIKVFNISVYGAIARIQERYITLDVSGNGESISKKDFKRYEIEDEK